MTYVKDYTAKVAEVYRISDGDTWWLWLDPGFRDRKLVHVRLDGFDTPETHTSKASLFERQQGRVATGFAEAWFSVHLVAGNTIWVRTKPDPEESLDRWLGEVWASTPEGDEHLGEMLRERGLATAWPTRWYQEHDPQRDKPWEAAD